MTLSNEDFAILLALESNPSMPMTELANLLDITRITAKKRVDDLKERQIIRDPIAIYNPVVLGLDRISVIAKVQSLEKLQLLEKACDEHPYTHYRARAFGGDFGLFIQFDTPINTTKLLGDFFKKLIKENIITSYELLPSIGIRYENYADLKRYNIKMSNWNFSWNEWFNNLPDVQLKIEDIKKVPIEYSKFQETHFKILRMLTANGSIKQTDIKEKLKLSKTQTHREYNYVMENYIETIRFIYNREIFDLTETYVAIGYNLTDKKVTQIFNAIKDNPPPFRLALDVLANNKLLLWADMSPAQASNFAFSMWQKNEQTKIYTLDTKKSRLYWFYPDNFDFNEKCWKVSEDYFITTPLKKTLMMKLA
ncbi:MAG: winged helix-turn-helix transcriptional regulator [Candidatus Heimdallarchaeota archaeon]|nr:winged helix-turn-helix transcriptional regulator [Candidatus Heimdallarchaeota archaeon]